MDADLIRGLWPDIRFLLQLLILVWGIRGCFLALAFARDRRR
jgi:hypothetical protein